MFGFPTASEHGAEVPFLFGSGASLSAGERLLAAEMKTYWANFVKTGDPNLGRRAPLWILFNLPHTVQNLSPGLAFPRPLLHFRAEHFCGTWQPILAGEPQHRSAVAR